MVGVWRFCSANSQTQRSRVPTLSFLEQVNIFAVGRAEKWRYLTKKIHMKIENVKVAPNEKSINRELIFSFTISEIAMDKIPLRVEGQLFSDDGYKLGDLKSVLFGDANRLWLNAKNSSDQNSNPSIPAQAYCYLSEKAINHIENFRLNKKENTKDVIFQLHFSIQSIELNVTMGNIYKHEHLKDNEYSLIYKHANSYSTNVSNMWLLSGNGGPNIFCQNVYTQKYEIRIDLMEWINTFTSYMGIGRFIVYEFLEGVHVSQSKEIG